MGPLRPSWHGFRRAAGVAVASLALGLAAPASAEAGPVPGSQETAALATALAGQRPSDAALAALHDLVAAAEFGTTAADDLDQVVRDALVVGGNAERWDDARSRAAGGDTVEPDSLMLRLDYPPVAHGTVRYLAAALADDEAYLFVRFLLDGRLVDTVPTPYPPSVRVEPPKHTDEYLAAVVAAGVAGDVEGAYEGGGRMPVYCDGEIEGEAGGEYHSVWGRLRFCYDYRRVVHADPDHAIHLDTSWQPFVVYRHTGWIQNEGEYVTSYDGYVVREAHHYHYTWQPTFETCFLRYGCTFEDHPYLHALGYSDGSARIEASPESWPAFQ